MLKKRLFIRVSGIVQGVGFRPFVYNTACNNLLKGWVNNNSEGVYIDIEGDEKNIKSFIYTLKNNPPPLSKIENMDIEEKPLLNYKNFSIHESEVKAKKITLISPDISICEDCLKDIKDPNNRRYRYAFTNCTNCGPRFSIIKSIPYDRDKTTMEKFEMCIACQNEYTNPSNRRFHAQPNACAECGPNVWLCDNNGTSVESKDAIKLAARLLKEGKILAIKGLCGFHLVCDAHNKESIELLRKRKNRPDKPFALMMDSIDTVLKYCKVNEIEKSLLTGIRKPIVLLNCKEHILPEIIAPNQSTLGVMLPYTPLHEILFSEGLDALIMTSANVSGLPLEYENLNAIKNLSSLVDYFLMHNRDIHIPLDDSVVKVVSNTTCIIRRARGYAPEPLTYKGIKNILACGANMKNTFAIGKENFIFLSQYNGDLENLETIEHYKRNIEHFKNIFSFKPSSIACDLHPFYSSTEYASAFNLPLTYIQHHHAHIVSCMVENNINTPVIGIAFDGTGYGTDKKIWGGEFLICDYKRFNRIAHLDYVKMPGGEKSILEPYRMGISYIYSSFKNLFSENPNKEKDMVEIANKLYGPKATEILKLIESNINCPETSSMGRFFDGVSSLLDFKNPITYEGQASIELEASLTKILENKTSYGISDKNILNFNYSFNIKKLEPGDASKGKQYIIEPYKAIMEIIEDKINNLPTSLISLKFHNTVITFTVELCKIIRSDTGLNQVILSGGVFQNTYLFERVLQELIKNDFTVYTHKLFPCNDGGVALGQIVIANELSKDDNPLIRKL